MSAELLPGFMSAHSAVDVAVIGAGPAGAATARGLAQAGLRVVLLEGSSFEQPRVGESLAPDLQPLLKALGLWPEFCALHPLPSYGNRSAWGSATVREHSHLMTPWQNGWHIERTQFDRMLADGAARAGVEIRLATRVRGCIEEGEDFRVLLGREPHASPLRARFVVDATGRGTPLARSLRARHVVFDRLVAVAAQFRDPAAHSHGFTLVETTAEGWWYCAPVGTDRSVVMLMSDGDLIRTGRLAVTSVWDHALGQTTAIADCLKHRDRTPMWGPKIFPAVSQRLLRAAPSQRWLAVGDAALAVDPVSGSGVIRALRMATNAVSTILAHFAGHKDALSEYESVLDAECTDYLVERASYYGLEQRWQSPFWQRRAPTRRIDAAPHHSADPRRASNDSGFASLVR
jgi:flavin-dependent dehydrogenase